MQYVKIKKLRLLKINLFALHFHKMGINFAVRKRKDKEMVF